MNEMMETSPYVMVEDCVVKSVVVLSMSVVMVLPQTPPTQSKL